MNFTTIIFDMDGLLIDSEPVWDEARARMAAERGKPWNQDDHYAVMGVSTQEWVDYMRERLSLEMSDQAIQDEIINQMGAIYAEEIPFRPGAVELIQWAAANHRTALASGSPRKLIDAIVTDERISGCFEVTFSADEVGLGKPDPAVYLKTAEVLGVPPTACVVLEDSPNGVLSGQRAGMFVINVPDPRYPLTAEQAQYANVVLPDLDAVQKELTAV